MNQPVFHNDRGSDAWLQRQIDIAIESGRDAYGAPYFGKVTGWFSGRLEVPLSSLSPDRVFGCRNEERHVRHADLDAIKTIMQTTGRLPEIRGEEYQPFIQVAYDGSAWVSEGNHRLMAARALGWERIAVEIRYFDGGEANAGCLSPDRLLAGCYDTERVDALSPGVV